MYNSAMAPETPIESVFRLTPIQRSALKRLGVHTVRDFLYHFPSRYDTAGDEQAITGLVPGAHTTIFGTIGKLDTRKSWKRKIPVGEAVIHDGSGSIKIMWFHQPYMAKKFVEGAYVRAVGVVGGTPGKLYLANPHVEIADPHDAGIFAAAHAKDPSHVKTLFAVYPETRGVTSLWFRHAFQKIRASGVCERVVDPIPDSVRAAYHLPDLGTALIWIHAPEKHAHAEAARKRFSFEEIFVLQITRARERAGNDSLAAFPITDGDEHTEEFLSSLSYAPTKAQRRAVAAIMHDFTKPHPMARLLEGDVGSGKTLVAAATAYAVVKSRPPGRASGTLQVAYMAPTEILAGQHFQSFIEHFKHLPINIALLTGSGCKKFPSKISKEKATDISRAQLLKWVASGEIAMVVGTHALIQKSVKFQHLAYAIVDEQHRFGTRQRRALAHSANLPAGRQVSMPHFLSMTATPIPRTLALTLYGDLDISVLDELPAGRALVSTEVLRTQERERAYERMRTELAHGRQAYVVCPRIEEPDPAKWNAVQAKSAKAEAKRLQKDVFQEYVVGLLHGGMKPKEKDAVMRRFSAGEIHVLVATSVVEVGVNVPNATVILIEGAERFGLAQLHQLRGRVQRSSYEPYCFLLAETVGEISMKRLRAMEKTTDGFVLAEEDLKARGAGDLYGRQQWGISDIGMEALKNPKLIAAARTEAQTIVTNDAALSHYPALQERAAHAARSIHAE